MRLVRKRQGGGLLLATAAITTLVVIACAKGTDGGDVGEGGVPEQDAARDTNVVPTGDSAPQGDSGKPPEDDSGSCTSVVVINEVQTRTAASAQSEFVELYNPSTCAVPMGDWDIGYKSAAGNGNGVLIKFPAGTSIPAKSFFVIASDMFVGKKDADFAAAFTGMADDGRIALRDDTGTLVDAVGFGTATGAFVEKTAGPGPAAGNSVGRKSDGVDTDNNSADFKLLTPPSPGVGN